MPYRPLARIALFVIGLLLPLPALAQQVDLVWTSATAASGGGITATAAHVTTAGTVSATDAVASHPAFVAEFGSAYSVLGFISPPSLPADIDSTITFSPALPAGARLVVADVDFESETMTLTSGGAPLTLLSQLESVAGASSTFPTWSPPQLIANGPASTNNDLEASVFDLSGVASLEIAFDQGLGSGVNVSIFVPPPPVPVAGSAGRIVLITALIGLGWVTSRSLRRPQAAHD